MPFGLLRRSRVPLGGGELDDLIFDNDFLELAILNSLDKPFAIGQRRRSKSLVGPLNISNSLPAQKPIMASVVRLSLTLIVCVQLALGNLPALMHQASCDCPTAVPAYVATGAQSDNNQSSGEVCDLHCHCKHDDSRESSDVAANSHSNHPEHSQSPISDTHDEDRCALCQSVYVYGAHASFVSVPAAERFFGVPLPVYRCEALSGGDCILPSPRGPPLG